MGKTYQHFFLYCHAGILNHRRPKPRGTIVKSLGNKKVKFCIFAFEFIV